METEQVYCTAGLLPNSHSPAHSKPCFIPAYYFARHCADPIFCTNRSANHAHKMINLMTFLIKISMNNKVLR